MKSYINYSCKALLACFILFTQHSQAQVTNLISANDWNTLFPKRAGTFGTHPQGYTYDFYSYTDFSQAVSEMADYKVEIQKKQGVWGEYTTVTRKSTNTTYIYSDVESWWHTNQTPVDIIQVDFEDFINTLSVYNNKRELAAFLANISKETTGGWQLPVGGGSTGDYADWGLYYVHELGYNSTNGAGAYSQASTDYPPNSSVGYYGRGPIQLSWNYNYGAFSKFLFNDVNILLNNPDMVQNDGVLAFKSAIWFWMMPQCPKPSCHQVMHETWEGDQGAYSMNKMYTKGFAHTNNIINGGLECRSTSSSAFTQKVVLRSELYQYYLSIMGFSSSQIAAEDQGQYSTLCYESSSDAMENYLNCVSAITLAIDSMLYNKQKENWAGVTISPSISNSNSPIKIESVLNILEVRVYDAHGKQIQTHTPHACLFKVHLPKGLIFLHVITKNGVIIRKVYQK